MNKISRRLYSIPYFLWIVLFVVLPVLLVAYYSFFDVSGNFTFDNYRRFLTPVYLKMTVSSFWYAFGDIFLFGSCLSDSLSTDLY